MTAGRQRPNSLPNGNASARLESRWRIGVYSYRAGGRRHGGGNANSVRYGDSILNACQTRVAAPADGEVAVDPGKRNLMDYRYTIC